MTHGCATKQGPKCSGTSPQPGAPRSETSLFPQCPGKHPAWLIRASPQAVTIRESKEKYCSWVFCCPSTPALRSPTHSPCPGSHRAGLAQPWLCPAPRNTQPCWKQRGKLYSDCNGAGSEAKRDGKVEMSADFNGKKSWLSSLKPGRRVQQALC